MLKHPAVTEARLTRLLAERLPPLLYPRRSPVDVEIFEVHGEPIPHAQAVTGPFRPFAVGGAWGGAWDTAWMRVRGTVPTGWEGAEVFALMDFGFAPPEGFMAEGLVWRDGRPAGALNVNRQDVALFTKARGGESFEFHVEAAANPRSSMRHGDLLLAPDYDGPPIATLRQAELVTLDREAWALLHDFKACHDAMLALPEASPRRGQLLYALNEAANRFDANPPSDAFAPMREALAPALAKRNGDSAHRVSATGHAHIDTAWLWPLRETIRKCARTFSTALAYMAEYPDYRFACSQAQQYAWMKEFYPDIYEGIKRAVKRGQWEPVGSMWVEADCNLSSGESLVRQMLHGKNFWLDEFGYETTDVWMPDVFGYAAALPQLMRRAGVEYFLTQKISWNQFNKFPHHTFLWEGIDGTRIFTHFPPTDTYNANLSAKELVFHVANFKENDRCTRSLAAYGFGDGGGGPTKEMLELAARYRDFDGLPRVELESVREFFPKAVADARDLPVWVGELYLELHRGTLTTQAANKRGNRRSEFHLRDAEFLSATTAALRLSPVPVAPPGPPPAHAAHDVIARENGAFPPAADWTVSDLDRAWKLVLLNQFHDIIPGSSIHWVYQDSARDYATVATLADRVIASGEAALGPRVDTAGFARPVVVLNTLTHPRREVVDLPGSNAPALVDVPGFGHVVVEMAGDEFMHLSVAPVRATDVAGCIALDNSLLRVTFAANGELAGVYDHRARREVLAAGPGLAGNRFQIHPDYPNSWDAWDVDAFYRETVENLADVPETLEIVEGGPLRATVRVVRRFGNGSLIEQHVTLCAGSPRLDFATRVEWREDHRFLKVAFPVNVRSLRATYEIQFGHTERPTHENTSWDLARFEVCAQKWADLSEPDYGVALLNDGKYGHDIHGNVMRLSLLRAPTCPDPLADRGEHRFTYALLPHPGDFRAGGVVEQSYALNVPLRFVRPPTPSAGPAGEGTLPARMEYFTVDRPGVCIEAWKRAEKEDSMVLRLYEAWGTRGTVTLTNALGLRRAFVCDLLERRETELPVTEDGRVSFDVTPFQIVTLLFPQRDGTSGASLDGQQR